MSLVLANDPHEDHNLAATNRAQVEKMIRSLQTQIDEGRSTPGPRMRNDRDSISVFQRLPDFVREQLR